MTNTLYSLINGPFFEPLGQYGMNSISLRYPYLLVTTDPPSQFTPGR